MTERVRIARYTFHVFSSREDDDRVVFLYDDGSNLIGRLTFVPDNRPLPDAKRVEATYMLYFRRSAFPEVLDMLRNEGPIYLHWNGGINTSLSSEYEPVGEGELARR